MPEAKQAAPWVFYGSLGLIVLIPFLFRTTAVFVVNLIGFIYPTFASAVAVLKNDDKLIGQWLIYWVVYAGILVVQRVFSVILDKIPFYPLFNALFLIALMHYPIGEHSTLAKYVYWKFFAKYFGKAAVEADDVLQEAAGQMRDDPQGFAGNLMNGNENKRLSALIEGNGNFLTGQTNPSKGSRDDAYSDDETEVAAMGKEVANAAADHLQQIAEETGEKMVEGAATSTTMSELSENQDANNNQGSSLDADSSSSSRVELFKRTSGNENSDKLSSSHEVLPIENCAEDLDVDIDGELEKGSDEKEEKKEL